MKMTCKQLLDAGWTVEQVLALFKANRRAKENAPQARVLTRRLIEGVHAASRPVGVKPGETKRLRGTFGGVKQRPGAPPAVLVRDVTDINRDLWFMVEDPSLFSLMACGAKVSFLVDVEGSGDVAQFSNPRSVEIV